MKLSFFCDQLKYQAPSLLYLNWHIFAIERVMEQYQVQTIREAFQTKKRGNFGPGPDRAEGGSSEFFFKSQVSEKLKIRRGNKNFKNPKFQMGSKTEK